MSIPIAFYKQVATRRARLFSVNSEKGARIINTGQQQAGSTTRHPRSLKGGLASAHDWTVPVAHVHELFVGPPP